MIHRIKVNTVLVSSLLLYEETSIIDFPYTVLFESFILCNLLWTVTNNAMTLWKHLMRTITLGLSRCNIAFLLPKIPNEFSLNFHSIVFLSLYVLEVFHFLVISTIEGRSSGGRKLVFFLTFLARERFLILMSNNRMLMISTLM